MNPFKTRYGIRPDQLARWLLCAAAMQMGASSANAQDLSQLPPPAWLEITLNGGLVGTEFSLCDEQQCLLPRSVLLGWRIAIPPGVQGLNVDGTDLVALAQLPGLQWRMDPVTQSLALTVPGNTFTATQRDLAAGAGMPTDVPEVGSFLNYSLSHFRGPDHDQSSAWAEWAVFGPVGVFTTTADLVSGRGAQRLDSTWTIDRPQHLQTISVGDAISDGGQWGRSTRFAGLQWRSNFAVRPDLVTFPLPGASGSSAVPATVDIYVDQILRTRTEVPAGPFEFNNLPVTTGNGEVEMVVRDAYGGEQIVRLDYFVSPRLLTPGLRAYEYSFGLQRRGYGESSSYQDLLVVATERRGITDGLTAEWHNELTSNQFRTGLGAVAVAPGGGLIALALAGSSSARGSGWLGSASYEWRGDRLYGSAGLSVASTDFDAGSPDNERTPRRRLRAAVSWALSRNQSLALSYLKQQRYVGDDFEFASLSYRINVGRAGQLQFAASRTQLPFVDTTVSMHYSVRLGTSEIASLDSSHSADHDRELLSLQRSPPALGGFGYRMALQPGPQSRFDLGLTSNQQHAAYSVELSRFMNDMSYRAEVSGGLAWVDNDIYASQRLYDSFAVVSVGEFPDVGVYADHRLITHTNAHGRALVPGLRAYQPNLLAIEQADLPFDARIDALQIYAKPPSRSGLLLRFPVQLEHSAQLTIVLDDGCALPATASVVLEESQAPVPLGLDGKVLLSDVAPGDLILRVQWRSDECRIAIRIPTEIPPGLDLGTHLCTGVAR
jgi:outer membrane usher protein